MLSDLNLTLVFLEYQACQLPDWNLIEQTGILSLALPSPPPRRRRLLSTQPANHMDQFFITHTRIHKCMLHNGSVDYSPRKKKPN